MDLLHAYSEMYYDLSCNRHVVKLIDAPERKHSCHKIRIVESVNVHWYVKLCHKYSSNRKRPKRSRKPDTRIKRAHVLLLLEKLKNGISVNSIYFKELKSIAVAYY